MKRLVNFVIALVISAGLIAGAGIAYRQLVEEQAIAAASLQAIEAVRASERLAAEWGAEVGRVRNQPDADFDSLKGYIPRLAAEREAIVAAWNRMGELPSDVRNGIRRYTANLRAKQELIERFKTDYAVVRNSQDFLLNDPEGGEALLRSAREGGRTAVEEGTLLMLAELRQFIRTPSLSWNMRAEHALGALMEASDDTPEAVKAQEIAAHVEVLLQRYALAEDRFAEAVSNQKIRDAAAVLSARLDSLHGERQISIQYLTYALIAAAGLLLVYWTYLVVRFFQGRRRRGAEAPVPEPIPEAVAEADAVQPHPAEETPAVAEAAAERAYDDMLRDAPLVAPAPVPAEPVAGTDAIRPHPAAEAPAVAEAEAGRAYDDMLPDAPLVAPAPVAAGPVAGADAMRPHPAAEMPAAAEAEAGRAYGDTLRDAPPVAPAPVVAAEVPAGPAPEPSAPSVREGGIGLTTQAMAEAVFGKLAEVAAELDRAIEAGEAFRTPGTGERSEEALAALLGRLAGARWNARRLAAQACGVLDEGGEARPDWQRVDLRDALASLLDTLDATRRGRITAVLLPGAEADVDRQAFQAAMERVLNHALEAAARHPEDTGHVELTLTTHEGRHCISCIDHGPGPSASGPAAGGAPSWSDTLDLDVARRLVTAQGGEFEAATYPPFGSRIRIWIPPRNGAHPRG